MNENKGFVEEGTHIGDNIINNYNYPQSPKQAPKFYFPLVKNLIERDTEVERLYGIVSENQFSNLYGLGGSGKTSLVNLLVEKHKDEFNQIACVVVNDNMEESFVNKINETIKLDLNAVKDRCVAVLSYLRENYESEKPNLMVLDVNSIDWRDVSKFVDNLKDKYYEYINGWSFLIISREAFSEGMSCMELSADDDSNNGFLKELFCRKAGDVYEDFPDFDELFKLLYHNPLLVELLGIKLKNKRKHSLDDIKKILGNPQYYQSSTIGVSVNSKGKKEEEKILIGYLRNLVSFEGLSEDEKKLIRHFVIWPTDYINRNIIKTLLKGVFELDDDLDNILDNLQVRGLLAFQENDSELKYKLHGLIAESIREQIVISTENYTQYLDNIDSLKEFVYNDFVQFAKCIGHSLSKYDITDESTFHILFHSADKLQECFFIDEPEKIYSCVIDKVKQYISEGRHAYYEALSTVYNNWAHLEQNKKDFDVDSVIQKQQLSICYNKKSESSTEQKCELANSISNLAYLYGIKGDFQKSKNIFDEALEVIEPIKFETFRSKDVYASICNNYATLLYRDLQKKEEGCIFMKNAIDARQELVNDDSQNTKYIKSLAWMYINWAKVYSDKNDYKSALNYIDKVFEVTSICCNDVPDFLFIEAIAYYHKSKLVQLSDCKNLEYGCWGDEVESQLLKLFQNAFEKFSLLPMNSMEYKNNFIEFLNQSCAMIRTFKSNCFEVLESFENKYKDIDPFFINCRLVENDLESDLEKIVYWINKNYDIAFNKLRTHKYYYFAITHSVSLRNYLICYCVRNKEVIVYLIRKGIDENPYTIVCFEYKNNCIYNIWGIHQLKVERYLSSNKSSMNFDDWICSYFVNQDHLKDIRRTGIS